MSAPVDRCLGRNHRRLIAAMVALVVSGGWFWCWGTVCRAQDQSATATKAVSPDVKPAAPSQKPAAGPAKAAPETKAASAAQAEPPAAKAAQPAPPAKADASQTPGAEAGSAPKPPAPVAYKQAISDEDYKKNAEKFKREKTNIYRILRAQTFGPGQQEALDAYYTQFALPRWTVPENLTSLPDFRRELRNDLLAGRSGPPYDRLLNHALNFMSIFSQPGYHPAVRYNAMLMLGELNVQEFAPGAKNPVVPLPQAQKLMLEAIRSSDSDAVKVAALLGLQRHISAGIADQKLRDQQIVPLLLEVAKSSPAPGRSAEGYGWVRALAIDALGMLRTAGPDGSVATTLIGLVGDKNAPMRVRTAAARALGNLDYQGFKALTPSQLAAPLGQLALDIGTAELARARAAGRTETTPGTPGMPGSMMPSMPGMMMPKMPGSMMPGMPGSMMPGTRPRTRSSASRMATTSDEAAPGSIPGAIPGQYGPMGGMAGEPGLDEEEAERVLHFSQRMKQQLNAVRIGLNGPASGPIDKVVGGVRAAADPASQDRRFIDSVLKLVLEHIDILDKKDTEFDALAKEIVDRRGKLRELLKGGPASAPAAPPTPAKTPQPTPAKS